MGLTRFGSPSGAVLHISRCVSTTCVPPPSFAARDCGTLPYQGRAGEGFFYRSFSAHSHPLRLPCFGDWINDLYLAPHALLPAGHSPIGLTLPARAAPPPTNAGALWHLGTGTGASRARSGAPPPFAGTDLPHRVDDSAAGAGAAPSNRQPAAAGRHNYTGL